MIRALIPDSSSAISNRFLPQEKNGKKKDAPVANAVVNRNSSFEVPKVANVSNLLSNKTSNNNIAEEENCGDNMFEKLVLEQRKRIHDLLGTDNNKKFRLTGDVTDKNESCAKGELVKGNLQDIPTQIQAQKRKVSELLQERSGMLSNQDLSLIHI